MKVASKKVVVRAARKRKPSEHGALEVYIVESPATLRDYTRTYGIKASEIFKAGELIRDKLCLAAP